MNISLNERHHAQACYQAQQVATILRDNPDLNLHRTTTSKLPGDELSLRGIPCLARGVGGAIPGTRPDSAYNETPTLAAVTPGWLASVAARRRAT